jgi:glycine/D-amino acid oxidase-like deaminating enzyme
VARLIVVGGGVIGTMVAYLATRRSCDVVQLEREVASRSEQVAESVWVVNGAGGRGLTMAAAIAERALDDAGLPNAQSATVSSTAL